MQAPAHDWETEAQPLRPGVSGCWGAGAGPWGPHPRPSCRHGRGGPRAHWGDCSPHGGCPLPAPPPPPGDFAPTAPDGGLAGALDSLGGGVAPGLREELGRVPAPPERPQEQVSAQPPPCRPGWEAWVPTGVPGMLSSFGADPALRVMGGDLGLGGDSGVAIAACLGKSLRERGAVSGA